MGVLEPEEGRRLWMVEALIDEVGDEEACNVYRRHDGPLGHTRLQSSRRRYTISRLQTFIHTYIHTYMGEIYDACEVIAVEAMNTIIISVDLSSTVLTMCFAHIAWGTEER